MRIRVYAPPFADFSRIDEEGFLELPEGASLGDLFRALKLPFHHGMVAFCMVNYEKSKLSRILAEGDTVSFISLLAGG
ncbi:MAG: MoaD/ThiS family protein [Rectinemataceae bacterium]